MSSENRASVPSKSIVMMVHDRNIDRRVLDEARSLIQDGWKVTVIAAGVLGGGSDRDQASYPDVPIIRVELETQPGVATYTDLFRDVALLPWRQILYCHNHFYIEAIKHPAQVYVAHDLPQMLAAVMAADYYGAYVVYDAHELYPDQEHFIQDGRYAVFLEMDHWLAPLADKVITVNRSIAEFMTIRYKIPLPEVLLNSPALPNSSSLPLARGNLLRDELGIHSDKKILLYQGGIGVNRNLDNLVRAMGFVKDSSIVLVMMGPGLEEENELTHLADKIQLRNRKVYFRAAASQADLLKYTCSADAGVIPYTYHELNTYYCTPNKLFEYIVAGLPILANDLPELNRFVGQQGIGMNVSMNSPEEIAKGIDALFAGGLEEFRERCQALSPQYVWDTQGRKVQEIYRGLVAAPPKSVSGVKTKIPDAVVNALRLYAHPQLETGKVDIHAVPTGELVAELKSRPEPICEQFFDGYTAPAEVQEVFKQIYIHFGFRPFIAFFQRIRLGEVLLKLYARINQKILER